MTMKTFVDYLNKKFLDWQNVQGKRMMLKDYAEYLGVTPTSYSNWVNAGSIPSIYLAGKLAEKLGPEVYDILGYARPARTAFPC